MKKKKDLSGVVSDMNTVKLSMFEFRQRHEDGKYVGYSTIWLCESCKSCYF